MMLTDHRKQAEQWARWCIDAYYQAAITLLGGAGAIFLDITSAPWILLILGALHVVLWLLARKMRENEIVIERIEERLK